MQPVTTPLPKAKLAVLIWIRYSEVCSISMLIPMLPYFVEDLLHKAEPAHATTQQVAHWAGLILGIQQVTEAVASFPLGWISDRCGRVPVLLLGLAISVGVCFAVPFVPTVLWLLALRAGRGCGNANIAVTKTYVTEITDSTNRGNAFAAIGTAVGLGVVSGPLFSALSYPSRWLPEIASPGSLLFRFPFILPFFAVGTMNLCAVIIGWCVLDETLQQRRKSGRTALATATSTSRSVPLLQEVSDRVHCERSADPGPTARTPPEVASDPTVVSSSHRPQRPWLWACILAVLQYNIGSFIEFQFMQIYTLWAKLPRSDEGLGLDVHATSLLISVGGVGAICANMLLFPYLAQRVGPRKLMLITMPLAMISMACIPFMTHLGALIPFSLLFWTANFITTTPIILFVNNASPHELLGRVNGISQGLTGVARFLGPLSGGSMVAALAHRPPPWNIKVGFWATATIGLCAWLAAFALPQSIEKPLGMSENTREHPRPTGSVQSSATNSAEPRTTTVDVAEAVLESEFSVAD